MSPDHPPDSEDRAGAPSQECARNSAKSCEQVTTRLPNVNSRFNRPVSVGAFFRLLSRKLKGATDV